MVNFFLKNWRNENNRGRELGMWLSLLKSTPARQEALGSISRNKVGLVVRACTPSAQEGQSSRLLSSPAFWGLVKLCSQKKLWKERAYSVYRLQFEGGKLGLHFKAGTWDRDRAEAMLTPLGPWLTQFALLIQPMPTYPGMAPPIVGCSLLYQLTIRKMHSHAFAILMEAMPQLRVPFPGMSSWQDYLSWLYREPGSARKNWGYKWTLLKRENQRNK